MPYNSRKCYIRQNSKNTIAIAISKLLPADVNARVVVCNFQIFLQQENRNQ